MLDIFLYTVMVINFGFLIGIIIWVVYKNKQSEELYQRELDKIYRRRK